MAHSFSQIFGMISTALLVATAGCKSQSPQSAAQSTPVPASSRASNLADVRLNTTNWEEVSGTNLPQVQNYDTQLIPSDQIATFQPVGTGANGIPDSLSGIWWMDGNPLPDTTLSLAKAVWVAEKKQAIFAVFDADTFTFHGDQGGLALWKFAVAEHLFYEVQFADDLKSAVITPIQFIAGRTLRIPQFLAKFTMELAQDGLWIRHSWFFGNQVEDYSFTRIITKDKQPDHNMNLPKDKQDPYQRFLDSVPKQLYLIRDANK